MQKYLIPILLSGSLLLTVSCSRQPWQGMERMQTTNCLQNHIPVFVTERYRSEVNITGKRFGGILVVKKMNNQTTRTVFTGDAGITFFDMEFSGESFKVHYITPKLDRKPVINQLREDIDLVLLTATGSTQSEQIKNGNESIHIYNKGKKTTAFFMKGSCTQLTRGEVRTKGKLKTTAYFFDKGESLPDSVYIKHERIDFTISLKKLKQQ